MVKKKPNLPLIDAATLSLDEWLSAVQSDDAGRKYVIADYRFPTSALRRAYLNTAATRNEPETRDLIRRFLVPAGLLGSDHRALEWHQTQGDIGSLIDQFEYYRRLFFLAAWEGTTWILDLLPHWPAMAIGVIDAFLTAHIQFLPDGRIDGLTDAQAIIRARYLERSNPRDTLLMLQPRDFEYLVASAYRNLGYDVMLTPRSKDGGLDIVVRRTEAGRAEMSYVECKRYEDSVGVSVVRALLGVVAIKNATRGILVTTGAFTRGARGFAAATAQLDLVAFDDLNRLLNRAFGPEWPVGLDREIAWIKRLEVEAASGFIKRREVAS